MVPALFLALVPALFLASVLASVLGSYLPGRGIRRLPRFLPVVVLLVVALDVFKIFLLL